MIHDLDVISQPGTRRRARRGKRSAVARPVGEHRHCQRALRFTDGCIANITASRVALKRERKIRLFQADTYVSVDYGEKHVRVCRRRTADNGATITVEEHALGRQRWRCSTRSSTSCTPSARASARWSMDGRHCAPLEVAELYRDRLETA